MLDMLIIQLYRDLDNNIVKSSDDVNNQAAKICYIYCIYHYLSSLYEESWIYLHINFIYI